MHTCVSLSIDERRCPRSRLASVLLLLCLVSPSTRGVAGVAFLPALVPTLNYVALMVASSPTLPACQDGAPFIGFCG